MKKRLHSSVERHLPLGSLALYHSVSQKVQNHLKAGEKCSFPDPTSVLLIQSLCIFSKHFEWFSCTLQFEKYYTYYSHLHLSKIMGYDNMWTFSSLFSNRCSYECNIWKCLGSSDYYILSAKEASGKTWRYLFICPFTLYSLSSSPYQ